jgi:hypothetical protein
MSQQHGYEAAIRFAVDKLESIDLTERCAVIGLPEPKNGTVRFRAFGADMELRVPGFHVFFRDTGKPVKPADRILILHYLLCDLPIRSGGDLVSFRRLPGGPFYVEPFKSRTVRPLVKRIGNDLQLLKKNLGRFDWEPLAIGDFAARVHVIGRLYLTLIYRLGDEEFPVEADVLFDSDVQRVYNAEDAAVLAGRICLGLL